MAIADPSLRDKVGRLSESQVEALVRSLLGETSKRISMSMAQEGRSVSPHTVDSWIRKALLTLDVQSRDEAAQIVGRSERAIRYQHLISQSSPIVQQHLDATPITSRTTVGDASASPIRTGWPFPTDARQLNDDSIAWRILWPIIIAIGTIFAFSALYAVLLGWSELSSGLS